MAALKCHGALLMPQLVLVILTIQMIPSSSSSPLPSPSDHRSPLSNCSRRCGDVEIPYPFGMSENCYLNSNFCIKCNESTGTPVFGDNINVVNISVENHEMTIMWYVARDCYNEAGQSVSWNKPWLTIPTLEFSSSRNKFFVVGCDSYAYLIALDAATSGTHFSMGCMSICENVDDVPADGSCSGIGCCQVDIPKGLKNVDISPRSFESHTQVIDFNPCTYAFVTAEFNFSRNFLRNYSETELPVVVDWAIEKKECNEQSEKESPNCHCIGVNTVEVPTPDEQRFNCKCKDGFGGNPYLPAGCQDIDECKLRLHNCTDDQYCENLTGSFICKDKEHSQPQLTKIAIGTAIGFVALFIIGSWLYLVLKQRKMIQLKEKFFRQNGGLILQQKLSDRDKNNNSSSERVKIFTEEELKKATLNYYESTIIGQGGFGTVYKGFLTDTRIVAIKKSKLVDRNQTEQFINEVVVLSQINHRNVVKLLGCCLETQVPLLVYEFVPNGTLCDHIHDKEKSSKLVWEVRLRIAAETAEALSYLHSAASTPIIHRDVKPSNILVDNYTAKVSDFGASRLVPLDQTELATMVQGTLGYLDPEYLHTNQLTEKSDVYSYGVVLVELLTGKKAICFERPEDERGLAMHFLSSLKRGRLFEIVEKGLVKEEETAGNREQVEEVARLAKRCLNVNGEERPTMKEVAMELEGLRRMGKHPWANTNNNEEENEYLLAHETSISFDKDMISQTSINANITIAPNNNYDSTRDHLILDFSGR
ncbi:hypothetical protein TIFTF001_005835 [Ficus carica]|uniref:Protein kinase domain-containing protein n=1 Tax=Ficus carica TaxID=3494 RepID=A0AA88A915_FICCA|nr:hypothetical protein TIFTF001_005835 [Ficus carica]